MAEPNEDQDRDRRHLHVPDDDDVQPGDPEREPVFRNRHGRLVQDDGLDVPHRHHGED